MNTVITKLLVFGAAGLVMLPRGVCCLNADEPGPVASSCCDSRQNQQRAPTTPAKHCCCGDRINATEIAKTVKSAPAGSFVGLLSIPKLPYQLAHNPGSLEDHTAAIAPFRILFCVWRC